MIGGTAALIATLLIMVIIVAILALVVSLPGAFARTDGGTSAQATPGVTNRTITPGSQASASTSVKFEMRGTTPVLIKLPEIDFMDDKEGKPIAIQSRTPTAPSYTASRPAT